MGIHGLMKLLSEECPHVIKEYEMEHLTGRKVAVDASMAIYQFLIAVRSAGEGNHAAAMLTNEQGDVTSHIQGMFNRTIKMMSCGIKPVYVFDGKPPHLKGGELAKRLARRAQAESDLEAAKAAEEMEDVDKFSRRLVKVTKQHNEDCKQLLRLMGVPVLDAPCEAEAQCAELAKAGKVYATATEDMDALTFRTPVLLRKLTFSGQKQPIMEIHIEAVLSGLDLSYDQFVDLCILCGCDYCNSIKGVGPKTALKLIRQYKTLENIITHLRRERKYEIPLDWFPIKIKDDTANASSIVPESLNDKENEDLNEEDIMKENDADLVKKENELETQYEGIDTTDHKVVTESDTAPTVIPTTVESDLTQLSDENTVVVENKEVVTDGTEAMVEEPLFVQARHLFLSADVQPGSMVDLKWMEPDEEGLRTFLVEKMGFNVDRVNNGIKRLKDAQEKKSQQRMDSFFKPVVAPSNGNNTAAATSNNKRKIEANTKASSSSKVAKKGFTKGRK